MLMTLLLAGAATLPASAHDFWLLPSDFQMEEAGADMATVRLPSTAPGEAIPGLEQLAEEMLV